MTNSIAHIDGKLEPWRVSMFLHKILVILMLSFTQWLFTIFGLITCAWGVILYFTLPDSPSAASFLAPAEREVADLRPQKTQHSFKKNEWSKLQCIEALQDPKTWLIALIIGIASITKSLAR